MNLKSFFDKLISKLISFFSKRGSSLKELEEKDLQIRTRIKLGSFREKKGSFEEEKIYRKESIKTKLESRIDEKGPAISEEERIEKRKRDFDNGLIIRDSDRTYKLIDGVRFSFDKESLKQYENFSNDLFRVFISKGYLARSLKGDTKITYFHEWLMREAIEYFKEERKAYKKYEVHVHHRNHDKTDNRIKNLVVLTKDGHAVEHGFEDHEEMIKYIREKN